MNKDIAIFFPSDKHVLFIGFCHIISVFLSIHRWDAGHNFRDCGKLVSSERSENDFDL